MPPPFHPPNTAGHGKFNCSKISITKSHRIMNAFRHSKLNHTLSLPYYFNRKISPSSLPPINLAKAELNRLGTLLRIFGKFLSDFPLLSLNVWQSPHTHGFKTRSFLTRDTMPRGILVEGTRVTWRVLIVAGIGVCVCVRAHARVCVEFTRTRLFVAGVSVLVHPGI